MTINELLLVQVGVLVMIAFGIGFIGGRRL